MDMVVGTALSISRLHAFAFCIQNFQNNIEILLQKETGRNLTQSYNKSPYTHRKNPKVTWQHKNATKNFNYT